MPSLQRFNVFAALALALGSSAAIPLRAAPDDGEILGQPADGEAVNSQDMAMGSDVDQLLFKDGDVAGAQVYFANELEFELSDLGGICDLSTEQRRKLTLAGQGAIRRFFDNYENVKRRYEAAGSDRHALERLEPEIQLLERMVKAGLFTDRSFFAKVTKRTLTPDQWNRYRRAVEKDRWKNYRAVIETRIEDLGIVLRLRPEQHRAIVETLLEETEPPERFGVEDLWLIMHRIRSLPNDRLNALFDKPQRAWLDGQWQRANDPTLRLWLEGYLTDEEIRLEPRDADATLHPGAILFEGDFEVN